MNPQEINLTVAAAAAAAFAALNAGPMAARYVAQGRLRRVCAERRILVLTYDDGPGESMTPRVLDALRAHGARASFFWLGRLAELRPEIVDRAVREGHEVGSHSYRHLHPWKSLPWSSARDATDGFRALERWTPRDGLFRPPHGKLTIATWALARARGARFAWWTRNSGDTWDDLPDQARFVDDVRRRGGDVVLMHDFDREEKRAGYTLGLTSKLLDAARADGMRVATLGEVMSGREPGSIGGLESPDRNP
jgi:peptidoglycan/xylan/chitin deacetylase (PgdA/CDA1 family)